MISLVKLFFLGTLVIPLNKYIEPIHKNEKIVDSSPSKNKESTKIPVQPILRQYKVSFYINGQIAKNGYLFTETPQMKFFLNTQWYGFVDRKTGEYLDIYKVEGKYSMRVQMQNPVVTNVTPVFQADPRALTRNNWPD